MRRARTGYCVLGAIALAVACSNDWDHYDPRLGTGASTGSGGAAGGSAGSSGASGSGGATSGGASGSGGTPSGGSGGSGGTGNTGGTPSGGGTGNTGGTPSGGGTGNTGGTPSGGGTGNAGGAGGTGAIGGGGTGGAGPTTVTYVANVADCVDLTKPDPDACEAPNAGLLSIDDVNEDLAVSDASLGPPSAGFLRFNLDNAFAGKTITKIELVLRAGSPLASASDHSGDVWSVSTFTRPDLFTTVPTKIAKVANDLGAVTANSTVTWTLPNGAVSANTPACFGVYTVSTNGVDYQNTKGNNSPRLRVTFQ